MRRNRWGEDLNTLRPSPFDRATGPLVGLDNLFGKWGFYLNEVGKWCEYGYEKQPYRMWTMPTGATPSIAKSDNELDFLLRPDPVYISGEGVHYLRNLDINIVSFSVATIETILQVTPSTTELQIDRDEPTYITNDGWYSWIEVNVSTINQIAAPVTGDIQVAYRPLTASTIVTVPGIVDNEVLEFTPIYNGIDELGDTRGVQRRDNEGNVRYFKRIQSKLGAVGSSDVTGVAIETSRQLGLLEIRDWQYDKHPITHLIKVQDLGQGPTNHTTLSGATLTNDGASVGWGLRRHCMSFDGTGTYYIPWVSGMEDYTKTRLGGWVWIEPTNTSSITLQYVVTKDDFQIWVANNQVHIAMGGSTVSTSIDSDWHCISFFYYGDILSIGLDGQEKGEITIEDWELSSTENWIIGSGFVGKIDELHIGVDFIADHRVPWNSLVVTKGWPVIVGGPYGNAPRKGNIEDDILKQRSSGEWVAFHPINEPYIVEEGHVDEEVLSGVTIVQDTILNEDGSVTLPDWVVSPKISYTVNWWSGVGAVIPERMPEGRYRVYSTNGVLAQSLRDYRIERLTTPRGTLTPEGEALLKDLSSTVSWKEMRWDEGLYFYGDTPPLAPTPTLWDQNLDYPTLG